MLQLINKTIKNSTNSIPDIIPEKSSVLSSLTQQMMLDNNYHIKEMYNKIKHRLRKIKLTIEDKKGLLSDLNERVIHALIGGVIKSYRQIS